MANKLLLIYATLAFFLLTKASIYRTIVEFDEDDATNPIGHRPTRPIAAMPERVSTNTPKSLPAMDPQEAKNSIQQAGLLFCKASLFYD